MSVIEVRNHGPLVVGSNYWSSEQAAAGKLFISINAGAFRLLLPASAQGAIPEMATAREVLVSRGPWSEVGLADGVEVLFDDRTADPFALHLSVESFDRLPPPEDVAIPWTFTAWTWHRVKPRQVLQRPCWYRLVDRIPHLKPRGG